MGCLGKAMGCFGRTTMIVFGLIVVIIVIAIAMSPDTTNDEDAGREIPTTQPAAERENNQSQQSTSRGDTSQDQSSSSVTPAEYEVVEQEMIETPNQRHRWVVRIRMDPNASDEAKVLGIAEAVRDADESRGAGTITIVFAVSGQDASGFADVGRGYTSDDGQGMAGDGDGLLAKDREGTIQVEVGGEVTYFEK